MFSNVFIGRVPKAAILDHADRHPVVLFKLVLDAYRTGINSYSWWCHIWHHNTWVQAIALLPDDACISSPTWFPWWGSPLPSLGENRDSKTVFSPNTNYVDIGIVCQFQKDYRCLCYQQLRVVKLVSLLYSEGWWLFATDMCGGTRSEHQSISEYVLLQRCRKGTLEYLWALLQMWFIVCRNCAETVTGLILDLRPANVRRHYFENDVSHWLGASLESALCYRDFIQMFYQRLCVS